MPKLNFPHAWHLAFWNAIFVLVALLLITIAGEVYLRLTMPFARTQLVMEFVPEVGLLYKPNTMLYATNRVEFWVKSKVNSIGFLVRDSRSRKSIVLAFLSGNPAQLSDLKAVTSLSLGTHSSKVVK